MSESQTKAKKTKPKAKKEEEEELASFDHSLKIKPINLVYVSPNPWDSSNDVMITSSKKHQQVLWENMKTILDKHGRHYAHEGGMYLIYAILDYVVSIERKTDKA